MKYPLSVAQGELASRFREVLQLHVPPGSNILDPTCGRRHLWKEIDTTNWSVTFSDVKDYGQEIVVDIRDFPETKKYDTIVYDPPYFFGYVGSDDPRESDYGSYCRTYQELKSLITLANDKFPRLLQPRGKLILKCADQYLNAYRTFYPHHITWANQLTNFHLVDIMIYQHHRMSPTAFQVKNRPCCIIMHTYFLVFGLGQVTL